MVLPSINWTSVYPKMHIQMVLLSTAWFDTLLSGGDFKELMFKLPSAVNTGPHIGRANL